MGIGRVGGVYLASDQPKVARWGMSPIVVLLPEELSTRYNSCSLKMIGYRPEISLKRGNGWSGHAKLFNI
ncbi:hypothetical protein RIR_jg4897.t1 [Rhizophagus irregularis DAOM 181602=DAOM 197198]|nr:hypothetical protein RIR_jg4897.t1 [Rhizophagus irregularis DAOM 181602=DAOM 197198]